MIIDEIRSLVIRPSLEAISLWSQEAENLIFATGLVETNYEYLVQIGQPLNGGLGYWQLEPATHKSLKVYLSNRQNNLLLERILATTYMQCLPLDDTCLIWNLRYAAIMCRIFYFKVPAMIPAANDPKNLYAYYKSYYNSDDGAATYAKDIGAFEKACAT